MYIYIYIYTYMFMYICIYVALTKTLSPSDLSLPSSRPLFLSVSEKALYSSRAFFKIELIIKATTNCYHPIVEFLFDKVCVCCGGACVRGYINMNDPRG